MAAKQKDSAKKTVDDKKTTISFRCPIELHESLADLARLSRQDVTSLLLEMCARLVEVNKRRITNFRRQAATPIKMAFDDIAATPATPKKDIATLTTNADGTKGGDE